MARTLKELKETKDVEQAEVDRNHLLIQEKSNEELIEFAKGIQSDSGYNADDFKVTEGIAQLQKLAGLPSIATADYWYKLDPKHAMYEPLPM